MSFFNNLSFIFNSVDASCKHHEEIHATQEAKIANMLLLMSLREEKGANQTSTLKQVRDTCWGLSFSFYML